MGRKIKNNVIMTDELAGVVDLKKISGARFKEVEYSSLAEKIALDKLFYVRFYYPGGRNNSLRRVARRLTSSSHTLTAVLCLLMK